EGVVHADVDAREADRGGERSQSPAPAPQEEGEDDRARDARGGMARRERAAEIPAEQRVGARHHLVGPLSADRELDRRGEEVGAPDRRRGDQRGRKRRLSGPEGQDRREGDPEKAGVPGHRERDEDPIERRDAVLDYPGEDVAVELHRTGRSRAGGAAWSRPG